MVKPNFSLHELKDDLRATRQFTDREEPRDSFRNALEYKVNHPSKHIVLNFYGVGGIGKTRLREELENILQTETEIHYCTLNFENTKYREQGSALIQLCTELKKDSGIKFKNFALAYAIYWKKVQPHIPLHEQSGLSSIFEEGEFLSNLIATIEDAPMIGWIGKSIKFATSTWNKYFKEWWDRSGSKIADDLQVMDAHKIERYLPWCFAQDVKEFVNQSSSPLVVFIDTYEALWEINREVGSFHNNDEWVRELVAHLPEVIWVILGREKLNWEEVDRDWKEVLDQHLLENLSPNDIKSFLVSCAITDENVQNYIINSSKGVPFYLDIAVDIYYKISQTREMTQEDFPVDNEQLRERFLRYLDLHEKETLKVLAVPRFWDLSLFEKLVKEFNTQYPISAYRNLFHFSFVNDVKNKDKVWCMHSLMREVLLNDFQNESPELFDKALRTVFDYFNNKIKSLSNIKDFDLFIEAFYFGNRALSAIEFGMWKSEIFSYIFPDTDKNIRIPRVQEMAMIMDIIEREENAVINVTGQAGIGKTTFVKECVHVLKMNEYLTGSATIYSDGDTEIRFLVDIAEDLRSVFEGNFHGFFEYIDQMIGRKILENKEEVYSEILYIWVNELYQLLILENKKLVISIDFFYDVDSRIMNLIEKIIKELPNVNWIIAGRESLNGWFGEKLYCIHLGGFSESQMKNYFKSLGSLGGGFVLQRIMNSINDIVKKLNVERSGLVFQLVLEFYFGNIAKYGKEPSNEEMFKVLERYLQERLH